MRYLTAERRTVFSLSAPTQPVKPIMKVTAPATISINAGSSATFVSLKLSVIILLFE